MEQPLWKTLSFVTKDKVVFPAKACTDIGTAGLLREEMQIFDREIRQKILQRGMPVKLNQIPVIETRPSQVPIRHLKSQRPNQVEWKLHCGTKSGYVPRIRRDSRFDQHYLQWHLLCRSRVTSVICRFFIPTTLRTNS